ncbi:MAG: trigger factor [Candidatus Enteromonas sp.]|jgi:trigger factor|nr:trigger factor [Bacilli bacterium]MEE3402149.1 trigger factor [Candidatus Enteromonas sp.]MBQ4182736.1 trigger factor [Bacilli bacterium]MEE3426827.1 trigger factor [Candidatus Enteromonas sp.]MEE3442759.1 trigger factor [Candidatus Enteromonas sp.]
MAEKFKKVAEGKVSFKTAAIKEDWKNAQEKAFHKLATKVKVDGFRPGKYPESMLRGKIDPNKIFDEAINQILPLLYGKAIREADVQPYGQPAITVTKLSDEELEVEFTVSVMPSVKLGEYKGLTAKKEAPSVSDKEVEERIQNQLKGAATLEVVDREAKMGDTVVIDFEGYVDGKAFEGGKADNYALELGSHSFVPGFEEALVGVKTGEKKDVRITFPENYVKELASKDALFKCKVHEIKERKIPELNDEAVKDLGIAGVETVEALKEKNKADILAAKVNDAERAYFSAILDQIVAGAKIEIADEIVAGEAKEQEENMKKRIESQGLTFEQYLEITGEKIEDFRKKLADDCRKNLTEFFVLQTIGRNEKLTATDEDVDAEIAKMAENYKMKPEEIKKAIEPQLDQLKSNITNRKIQEFILANNK